MPFNRGYSSVTEKLKKSQRYTMSCKNCDFFSQEAEDEFEVCQNPDVLEYDVICTSERVYCTRWTPVSNKTTFKELFKKGVFHFHGG